MDQLVTVIVQTSPIPSHPSTALLEALFRSFDRVDGLRECRIVIVADGCDEVALGQDEGLKRGKVFFESAEKYRQHLKLLQEKISEKPFDGSSVVQGSVEQLVLQERHGSARAIQYAVNTLVQTPFVMICQHDNFFVRRVPLRSVLSVMRQNSSWLKAVHFMATATMNYPDKVRKRYGLEIESRSVPEIDFPLIPLVFWFGRTHVARTDYYHDFVLNRNISTGDHLEELIGQTQLDDILENGMAAHDLYGNYVLDQGHEVLYHLSGRRARAASQSHGDCYVDDGKQALNAKENNIGKGVDNEEKSIEHDENPQGASFTSARSCRAIVPGLELAPPASSVPPTGRFRQKCFHCGVKGHSYRFCPNITQLPETETIDLS